VSVVCHHAAAVSFYNDRPIISFLRLILIYTELPTENIFYTMSQKLCKIVMTRIR